MSQAYPPAERALVGRIVGQPAFQGLFRLPVFAWQEVALLLACYAVIVGGAGLYLQGMLAYPVLLIASSLAMYATFTPLHDATHRSVSHNNAINDLIGTLALQPLVPGGTVSVYRYLHLEHHRHTGDPDLDPDEALVSSGPMARLLTAMFIELKWTYWYFGHLAQRSSAERSADLISVLIYFTWHIVWLTSPFALEFILLWMIPQRLGMTMVAYLFAAIQHPEGVLEHERPFQATRMFRGGALVRILMISQSQHLVHHLFPRLPYYRYNAAWRLAEPALRGQQLIWDVPVGRLAMPPEEHACELLRVEIVAVEKITDAIKSYTFAAVSGEALPRFEAGSHIDVHLAPDLVRQYSLTGLAEDGCYSIAVKREANGRGGSCRLHEQFRVGHAFRISHPRNLFHLEANATQTVLVAGGIGITPILSMARELERDAHPFALHVCARSERELPFRALLDQKSRVWNAQTWFGERGLSAEVFPLYAPGKHMYLCGPAGFMVHVRNLAAQRGWPAEAVHTEDFHANQDVASGEPFSVELARSGRVLEVPGNQSLLDVLQQNEVRIAASCAQGLCGTCGCNVISGEVEHRDQFFSDEQHASGLMATCVSRARGQGKLTLDL